jgi:hypothetical protein
VAVHKFLGILEDLSERWHQFRALSTVNVAMVDAEVAVHHIANNYLISLNDWSLY